FFFQAEDGIRDLIVTGVQTCALPILAFSSSREIAAWASESDRPDLDGRLPTIRMASICEGKNVSFLNLPQRFGVLPVDQRARIRSEEHTPELQSRSDLVCRLLLEKKK